MLRRTADVRRWTTLVCLVAGALLLSMDGVRAQGGVLIKTWDSDSAFQAPSGPQPVKDWYYFCYQARLTHARGDMLEMTWVAHAPPGLTNAPPGWSLTGSLWAYFSRAGNFVIEQGPGDLNGSPVDTVRGWKAPQDGTVVIRSVDKIGRNFTYPHGDGWRAQIWRNDVLMWERVIPAGLTTSDPSATTIPNVTFPVNTDDFIWFHGDHGDSTDNDGGLVFNPVIDLFSAPAGYATTTVSTNSVSAFNNTQPQVHPSHQGWSYWTCDHTVTPNAYAQMTATGTDSIGPYWSDASTYCRIWSDRAHPSWDKDAVRRWTAPVDGTVLLAPPASQPLLSKSYATGDPVRVLVYHTSLAGNPTELYDEVVEVGKPANLGTIVHMRAGETLDVHLRWYTSSTFGWYVTANLQLDCHPPGAPQPTPLIASSTTTVNSPASSPTWWFHRDVRITGNLEILGHLTMDHCFVQLVNSKEREFAYHWNQFGELRTRNSRIGGNVTSSNVVLHSNFEIDAGKWRSRTTTVQYTYGHLLQNGALLHGRRHIAGPHADAVILPGTGTGTCDVQLTDSHYPMVVAVPCLNSTAVTLDLPIDTALGTTTTPWTAGAATTGTNHVPFAPWNLSLVNTVAPWFWHLHAHQVGPGTSGKSITVQNCARIAPAIHHDGGQTATAQLVSGTVQSTFPTFGLTWNFPTSTEIPGWGAYFHDNLGASDIALKAPSSIAELMLFDNAQVSGGPVVRYQGTVGVFDAKTSATTVWAKGPQSRLTLAETEIGTSYVRGEVKATNDAIIEIRHARLPNDSQPIYLRSTDDDSGPLGPGRFVIYDFHDAYDPSKVIFDGPGPFDIYPGTCVSSGSTPARWRFASGIDGWLNWQTGVAPWYEHGFLTASPSWTAVSGALHLEYPDVPLPNGTLVPRITAPGSASTTFDYTINGTPRTNLYLVVRMRLHQATKRYNGSNDPVCGLYFAGRSGGSWSTWNQFFRQMEVLSDDTWHTYAWNINTPSDTTYDPILTYYSNWAPLPSNLDYWSVTFNDLSGLDTLDLGDYVDVDYVVITDDPRGWTIAW